MKDKNISRSPNISRNCYGYFMGKCYTYVASCGHSVQEGNKFCPHCGIKLIWPDWDKDDV